MLKSRQMIEVRTRFAPSPTGFLHIGGLRTALYSYAFAKSQNGKLILRIEDTDRRRFVPGATEKVYEILKIFGIDWDEGPLVGGQYQPYVQSERVATGIYKKYAEKLLEAGKTYYCFCEVKEKEELEEGQEGGRVELRDPCRDLSSEQVKERLARGLAPAIRLKVPDNAIVEYEDFVIGKKISWETKNIDEAMLLKSDGFPTYHLAVVVDDYSMKVSHIVRGHDWMPSTPIHLLLMDYLGFARPQIGHLTDILDPEGGKLSKRKGSVSCEEMLAEGYLPEAILNFIMLLGWAPKDNRELFTLKEFVENFQNGNLQIANPVFNREKLDWFNGEYIRQKTDEQLLALIKPFSPQNADEVVLKRVMPLIKDRIVKLSDFSSFAGFIFQEPKYDENLKSQLPVNYQDHLDFACEELNRVEEWTLENIQKKLDPEVIKSKGWKVGDFFMSFRIAIAGSRSTPPITNSVELIGKAETLKRLNNYVRS